MPITPFPIQHPDFGENGTYRFSSAKGIQYEVMFGRRENNPLYVSVVFGVVNDEFDGEEYAETNQGEQYAVMATIVQIIRHYIEIKSHIKLLEFTGVSRDGESENANNIRIRFFSRYLPAIFPKNWNFEITSNKLIAQKVN